MDTVNFHILWTVALFILFIAIVLWAWSSKRKTTFQDASMLPLEEDQAAAQSSNTSKHGVGE